LGTPAHIDPDQATYNFWRKPDVDGIWNREGYVNERVHELLAEQRRATDCDERVEILHELEDLLMEDCARIFLEVENEIAAYLDKINGYTDRAPREQYLETSGWSSFESPAVLLFLPPLILEYGKASI